MNENLIRVQKTFVPKTPNGIFLLGEFAEVSDYKRGYHFSGGSGQELRRMCREADPDFNFYHCHNDMVFSVPGQKNFKNSEFYHDWSKETTHIKPKYEPHVNHIHQAIYDSGATLVVALGDLALYSLLGHKSVSKYRGSCLSLTIRGRTVKVIPTYAPSRVLKVWNWRWVVVHDLRRAWNEHYNNTYDIPSYNFIVEPDFTNARDTLETLCYRLESSVKPILLAHDIETINRFISCYGIAWSATDAICIPFMTSKEGADGKGNYWTVEQETKLVKMLIRILQHPNARNVGQNFLYDLQHINHSWGVSANIYMDTMLAWHTVFPGERKSLDFLASLFCDYYVYWKDELKDYNKYPADILQYWNYNCKDCIYTWEIATKLGPLVLEAEQKEQYNFQMSMYKPVFKVMRRGVRVDKELRNILSMKLFEIASSLEELILSMTFNYHPPGSKAETYWFNSSPQTQSFFYDYLGMKKVINRKTGKPTTDDEALKIISEQEVILRPICQAIAELRSVNIFRKNFVDAPLGADGRIRCSYNLAGTETFRLASSKDAFGQGANLQTIPVGTEK